MRRQELDLARTRLLADSGRDVKHEELQKDFANFLDQLFPFRAEAMQDLVKEQKKMLDRWVTAGPIHFTPLVGNDKGARTRQSQRARGVEMQARQKKAAVTTQGPSAAQPQRFRKAFTDTKKPVKLRAPRK